MVKKGKCLFSMQLHLYHVTPLTAHITSLHFSPCFGKFDPQYYVNLLFDVVVLIHSALDVIPFLWHLNFPIENNRNNSDDVSLYGIISHRTMISSHTFFLSSRLTQLSLSTPMALSLDNNDLLSHNSEHSREGFTPSPSLLQNQILRNTWFHKN